MAEDYCHHQSLELHDVLGVIIINSVAAVHFGTEIGGSWL